MMLVNKSQKQWMLRGLRWLLVVGVAFVVGVACGTTRNNNNNNGGGETLARYQRSNSSYSQPSISTPASEPGYESDDTGDSSGF